MKQTHITFDTFQTVKPGDTLCDLHYGFPTVEPQLEIRKLGIPVEMATHLIERYGGPRVYINKTLRVLDVDPCCFMMTCAYTYDDRIGGIVSISVEG